MVKKKNTIEFLGIWEEMYNPNFNSPEFEGIKNMAGLNRFIMSVKQWIEIITISILMLSEKILFLKNSHLIKQVQFLQSDIWENVQGTFDLIISNPPYIPSAIVDTLTREVLHEPRLALDGGADGLEIVRPLCALAGDYLNPGGLFALELCKGQAAAVARGLEEIGWKAEVKKDIVGIERFVLARKI